MGLAQREIEKAGLSTVSLSMIADWTRSVGAPRVAAIEHPLGLPLGRPGDASGQRDVLRAALRVLEEADVPGAVVPLPFRWTDPGEELSVEPKEPAPIVALLRRRPWLFARLVSGAIPTGRPDVV